MILEWFCIILVFLYSIVKKTDISFAALSFHKN